MKNLKPLISHRTALLGLLALAMMFSYGVLARAQATTHLRFSQDNYWMHPGDTATLSLIITGASDMGGWETALSFDTRLLTVSNTSGGDFLASTGRTAQFMSFADAETPGVMALGGYSRGGTTGVDGAGVLAYVPIQAQAPGETLLELTAARLAHPDGQLINPQTVSSQSSRINIGYDLNASIADIGNQQVQLDWTQPSEDVNFDVWWNPSPYFYPGDTGSNDITLSCINNNGIVACLNSNALGNPTTNHYYIVRTLDANGNLRSFSHLAEFDFALYTD